MKVVDEALLAEFRRGGCEYRAADVEHGGRLTVHHVFTRSTGRLDVRINLICLCQACHSRHHDGNDPDTDTILVIVAEREGASVDVITSTIYALRRADTRTLGGQERAIALLRIARGNPHHHDRRQGHRLPAGEHRVSSGSGLPGVAADEAEGWTRF